MPTLPDARPDAGPGARLFGLDLIRATAILLVLASHGADMVCHWAGRGPILLLSYGAYYGIELFFVLSGFLIGGLLLRESAPAHPSQGLRLFLLRRWLRTLPLYYIWLVVLALAWAPLLWPGQAWHRLGPALPAYLVTAQNLFHPARLADFFDVSWSLAVEEWFYLLTALGWFALLPRFGTRAIAPILGLLVAGPILLRALHPIAPGGSDHIVPYWLDSIGIGVIAAWLAARYPARFRRAAPLAPLGLAAVGLTLFGGGLRRLGASPAVAQVFGVDLVALGLALLLPAALCWREARGPFGFAVRWLARLAYGLYLVHLSVLVLIDARRATWGLGPLAAALLAIGASLALALALHHLIEAPIMRRRPAARRPAAHQPPTPMPSSASIPSPDAA